MELLPEELILHVISFLEAADILPLNLVSKRFFEVSRDNELWKKLSLQDSYRSLRSLRYREGRYGGPIPIQEPSVYALQRAIARTTSNSRNNENEGRGAISSSQNSAEQVSLGPITSSSSQNIDWYNEYVARHAPLSMSWLPSPCDARGMGLLKNDGNTILVTPTEDGNIFLRNLGEYTDRPDSQAGQVIGRGNPGTLFSAEGQKSNQNHISSGHAVECVSIDQFSQRMYFAAYSVLTEVDLSTLQATSRQPFSNQICSLSEGGRNPNPLTVGTTKSVHIYDPRDKSPRPFISSFTDLAEGLSLIDSAQIDPYPGFQRLYSSDHLSPIKGRSAPIEPLPLSIIHMSHDIHVAGRFPSILTYDRRFFPQKMASIYSGARTSALIPFNSPIDSKESLIAAGEYKSKGSLEIYPLCANNESSSSPQQPIRNRVTASSSKLLSVIRHGTRILFSDSDGQLKWVERDGYSLVRRWNINKWCVSSNPEARDGIFNASADEGDVARKLLPIDQGERSDILIWTGEKVGIVGYGKKSRFAEAIGQEQEGTGSEDEGTASGDERKFGRMMRRALERQANEARFVQGLGLGL